MTTSSLITRVLALLSPDTLRIAADATGETRDTMRKLIEGAIPAALVGLTGQAGSAETAQRLMEILRNGSAGVDLAGLVFGPRAAEVTESLGRWAGVRKEVATHGLRTGCELALKALTDEHSRRGFSPASLGEFLAGQQASLQTFLPTPMLGLLGLAPTAAASVLKPESVSTLTRMAQVLGIAAVFLGTMWLYRGCGETRAVAQAGGPRRVEVKLPTGGALSLYEGSFNYSLVRFLEDKNDKRVPRTFVFDHLNFFTGETRITPESVPTVADLVAILKAFPEADVRLEGHTDTQGDAAANQKLSEERAAAIFDMLGRQGVAEQRMATAGYGQAKPVADNATEGGRAQNRRLELVVVKK